MSKNANDNNKATNKKYKLFAGSSTTEDGLKPLCAFFASPGGCRNGDNCKFRHVLMPDIEGGGGSVVSTESEGEVKEDTKKQPPQAVESHTIDTTPSKKKKKRKKKSLPLEDEDFDPFASPERQRRDSGDPFASPETQKERRESSEPPKKQHDDNMPNKKRKKNTENNKEVTFDVKDTKVESPRRVVKAEEPSPVVPTKAASSKSPVVPTKAASSKSNAAVPGYLKMKLPVTPFSTTEGVIKTEPKESTDSASETESSEQLRTNLPAPFNDKWLHSVTKSREHERYSKLHNFENRKAKEEELGVSHASDWVKAKPYGSWCETYPSALAIDCEMCETQDPVSGAKDQSALCRVSIVNADNPEEVLLDTLVKPAWPVTDYRTMVNGIKKEHLANVTFTLRHAQAFMMAVCSDRTVIVGHAIHNDLIAMRMEHYCCADTAMLYTIKDARNASASPSLKDLAKTVLHKEMPDTHDSVNDARTALLCLEHYIEKGGDVESIESSKQPTGNKLLVHRIPPGIQASHIRSMFLTHTSIQPEVEEIEFQNNLGKTHAVFKSTRHASLAYYTLEGPEELEKSGRQQKKVFLKNRNFIRVRMMVRPAERRTRREHKKNAKNNSS